MKKKWVVIAVIVLISIGGIYWMLKPTEDEKILAENKKFTSQFISDVAEEKDFKQFNSKTGKYSMLYPNEYYMSDIGYYVEPDFENWSAEQSIQIENNEVAVKEIQIMYRENKGERTQGQLNILLDDVSYEGQHKKMTGDDKTIYYGESHFAVNGNNVEILDPEKYGPTEFFAMVVDNKTQQFVRIHYSITCLKEENCNIHAKEEEEFFTKIYKSVQFE